MVAPIERISIHKSVNMSKLKRKKSAVEENKADTQKKTGDRPDRLRISDATVPRTPAECGIATIGSSWWIRSDLTEAEKLWVITLNDFCPNLIAGDGTCSIPELPELPTGGKQWDPGWMISRTLSQEEALPGDQRDSSWFWCSVDEDIPPLPPLEISSLLLSTPLIPTPDPQNPSDSIPSHPKPPGTLSQEEVQEEKRSGSGNEPRASDTSKLRSSEQQNRSGAEPEDGTRGSTLQCCPMCLIPFPAGFSQIECDGHLAQCLSEMNEDMVW